MKRSTILICIMYCLFVGLNVSLSIVLINQIKAHNTATVTTMPVDRSMLTDDSLHGVAEVQPGTTKKSKTTLKDHIVWIKDAVAEELENFVSSREHQEEVRNYIPFNPVYNFLQ